MDGERFTSDSFLVLFSLESCLFEISLICGDTRRVEISLICGDSRTSNSVVILVLYCRHSAGKLQCRVYVDACLGHVICTHVMCRHVQNAPHVALYDRMLRSGGDGNTLDVVSILFQTPSRSSANGGAVRQSLL